MEFNNRNYAILAYVIDNPILGFFSFFFYKVKGYLVRLAKKWSLSTAD